MGKTVGAGSAEVELRLRDESQKNLDALQDRLKRTGKNIALIGAAVAGTAALALAPLAASAKSFASAGNDLRDLAMSAGLSAETMSELQYATVRVGSNMSALTTVLKAIKSGNLTEIVNSKDAAIIKLMTANIAGLRAEARAVGATISSIDASAAAELAVGFETSAFMLKRLWFEVGAAVAPAVTGAVAQMTKLLVPVLALIRHNREVVRVMFSVLSVVATVGVGLAKLGAVVHGAGLALGFLSTAFGPLLVIGGLLVAIGAAAWHFRAELEEVWSSVRGQLGPVITGVRQLYGVFTETFGGILMALGSGQLAAAGEIAWLGLVAVAWTGVDLLAQAIDAGIDYLSNWIPGLDSVRDYFTATFGSIFNALLAGRWDLAGQIIMAKLRLAWQEGIDFLKDGWSGFTAAITSAFYVVADTIANVWHGAVDGIAQGIAWVMEKLGMADAGTLEMLKQDQARARSQRENNRSQREDPFMAGAGEVMAREKRRQELEGLIKDLERQANDAYAEAGAPTVGMVANRARTDLSKAIADAKAEMEGLQANAPKLNLQPLAKAQGASSEARGTFSAAAAAMFGAGGKKAEEETAANTRAMSQQLRRIARNTQADPAI